MTGPKVIALIGVAVILATLAAPPALPADVVEARGRLEAVTVYRGQALVTRVIEAAGPAGLQEIVISDLPEQVVAALLTSRIALRKTGLLRWDLDVPARTDGASAATVQYQLRLEYDKQMSITGLAAK